MVIQVRKNTLTSTLIVVDEFKIVAFRDTTNNKLHMFSSLYLYSIFI